jgi:predicted helicase
MAFEKIIERYRNFSTSEVDKGTKFERLMKNFLPLYYRGEIEKVMLWSEFSNEKDLGIDLVAKTYGGDYWAIQCKFYAENTIVEKSAVILSFPIAAGLLTTKNFHSAFLFQLLTILLKTPKKC